ncbi:sulfotransferase family protein [Acidihalobacter prosperus]
MSPFFIIGNPRSGTSLFRIMLNAHPDIAVPPECGFALWLGETYAGKKLPDEKVYRAFASDVYQSKKFGTWGVTEEALFDVICARMPGDYPALVECVYRAYAQVRGKSPVLTGDKNNYYINELDRLHYHFENSKLVFIVRDGRDVACSYRALKDKTIESEFRPKLQSDISGIAREWSANADKVLSFTAMKSIWIRYEDLLTDPVSTLTSVCEFLGVVFSDEMLDYQSGNDEPTEFLQWKGKTTEELDTGNISKFRTILSAEDIAEFESIGGAMLARFGYGLATGE